LSQNPLPIGTYNENNPLPNASTREDGEPAPDEPAADPPNDDDGESITNAAADAIPAADGILHNPGGEGDADIPPLLEPFETEVEDADETDSDDEAEAETTPTWVGAFDPDRIADLARQETSLADDKLIAVYGDTVHRNDGRDLHGGVEGDGAMQMLYDKIADHPHPMWSPPTGKVGDRFILLYAKELSQVRSRKHKFQACFNFTCLYSSTSERSFWGEEDSKTDGSVGGGDDPRVGAKYGCGGKERSRRGEAIRGR